MMTNRRRLIVKPGQEEADERRSQRNKGDGDGICSVATEFLSVMINVVYHEYEVSRIQQQSTGRYSHMGWFEILRIRLTIISQS